MASLHWECCRRLDLGEHFAVCYVEIDHFDEYRDRHGRESGERVVAWLSHALQDALTAGSSSDGFMVHPRADQFVLILAASEFLHVCNEICTVFDRHALRPLKLSIGVVTNEVYHLRHFMQFAELAREMLTHARTQPSSSFVVDRRRPPVDG